MDNDGDELLVIKWKLCISSKNVSVLSPDLSFIFSIFLVFLNKHSLLIKTRQNEED